MNKIIVKSGEQGVRLDSFISGKNSELSRTAVQRLIENGDILVNNNKQRTSYKVNIDDEITVSIPEAKEIDLKPQDIKLDIIYEDDDIIVVNKAKGMVVHPAARKSRWYSCKCDNEYM